MDRQYQEHSGCPIGVNARGTINKIYDLEMGNRRIKLREIASAMEILGEQVHTIFAYSFET